MSRTVAEEISELRDAIDRLQAALDDLVVRGLRASGPRDLARLAALRDEFQNAGATQIAERLEQTLQAIRNDDRSAASALLGTMTAVRLFDRFLTLEVASTMLKNAIPEDETNQSQEEMND